MHTVQHCKQPSQGGVTGTLSKQKSLGKYSLSSEKLAPAELGLMLLWFWTKTSWTDKSAGLHSVNLVFT